VAVVGDAEVDRGVILGAAFGNRVIEVARVSLNQIIIKATNADFDRGSRRTSSTFRRYHHTPNATRESTLRTGRMLKESTMSCRWMLSSLLLRQGRCGELTRLRGERRKDRLPRRLSRAKGAFSQLRMDDLFSVPVLTPLRNAQDGCAFNKNP
jgi:hypothetical protein